MSLTALRWQIVCNTARIKMVRFWKATFVCAHVPTLHVYMLGRRKDNIKEQLKEHSCNINQRTRWSYWQTKANPSQRPFVGLCSESSTQRWMFYLFRPSTRIEVTIVSFFGFSTCHQGQVLFQLTYRMLLINGNVIILKSFHVNARHTHQLKPKKENSNPVQGIQIYF